MTIGSAALGLGGDAVVVAVFTVIAASTVAVPVLGYLVAAERMCGPLDSVKGWLQENNATVMATLILVIGAVLVGKGRQRAVGARADVGPQRRRPWEVDRGRRVRAGRCSRLPAQDSTSIGRGA